MVELVDTSSLKGDPLCEGVSSNLTLSTKIVNQKTHKMDTNNPIKLVFSQYCSKIQKVEEFPKTKFIEYVKMNPNQNAFYGKVEMMKGFGTVDDFTQKIETVWNLNPKLTKNIHLN